jgi:AmmeMemoRadiSam system protein B/AmmeMemoRadiSam system protein A
MTIRRPAVAGTFYPADPGELSRTIAGFFAEVGKVPVEGTPLGLVAPHAGYPYSGRVAAKAYKLLEGNDYDSVVVISPSHTVFFKGASIFSGEAYATPLGSVKVDQELAQKMGAINPRVFISEKGHATGSARGEHALEVQLPFLQVVLGNDNFKLVPIVMGDQEEDTIGSLAEVLAASLKGRNVLMVASTDLSHFHSEKQARQLDREVQKAVEGFDPDRLVDLLETGKAEACGGGPTAAVMMAAKRLGAGQARLIDYATSGEVSGDFDNVVGYLSAAFTTTKRAKPVDPTVGAPPAKRGEPEELSEEQQQQLKKIAHDAIEAHLRGVSYEPPDVEGLDEKRGAFVTLNLGGQLRGCIGQIRGRQPLPQTIADMAVAAAFEDPRFKPLTEAESAAIDIEISVLTPLRRVHDPKEIKVGRDGLMIKLDFHSGLLLPQVATEQGWDRQTFLEQTCLKAGLPKNSYKEKFAEIYRFAAQVF